jgi:type II restriction/modification system DNA methylase subunit YeeA
MNTKNLKAYAPKARRQFIEAVKKRAAHLGVYADKISDVQLDGAVAIIEGRVFTRNQAQQRARLVSRIEARAAKSYKERFDLFVREMAYTWFNRLAAIRYMELHDYLEHGFRVLSHPSNPDSLPEILGHASEVADTLGLDKSHIIELQLAGDQEETLYRELLLGQCHHLFKIMPFMFEAIDDATELLLPDNLTKTDSILKDLVNQIPEEDWSQIEVIGWLYQFYISEHKDAVIGKVVKSEDIPAATQLFTPNWIVKYLVQNSLGRQWLATYPESALKGKMEYYIEPAEQTPEVIEQLKAITPTSIDPEQIKVLDPAVGSGHILVEVYDVLREIYLERGYRLREIPELILTKNIYGLDIDDRAAQLAGFALMMKAREDDRRIFQRVQDCDVHLNVYSLQSTEGLDIDKLWAALDLDDKHQTGTTGVLFDEPSDAIPAQSGIYKHYLELLNYLKIAFIQAKTLGSLIQIDNQCLANLVALKDLLQVKQQSTDPAAKKSASELMPIVNQAITLAQKYDEVVANPPYMGGKGMNADLKDFAKRSFPISKSDLFAIFMERAFGLLTDNGYNAQVNMQSWMFLSSFEKLRAYVLDSKTIISMAHLGSRAFSQISGEVVQTVAWVISKQPLEMYQPSFLRLIDGGEAEKRMSLLERNNLFTSTKQRDFNDIPGFPLAYWINDSIRNAFKDNEKFGELATTRKGLVTAQNDVYVRSWSEISFSKLGLNYLSREDAIFSKCKWFPYIKGGEFRKWYGNKWEVVNWEKDGFLLQNTPHPTENRIWATNFNLDFIFKPNLNWSDITGGGFAARYSFGGEIFDATGLSCFPPESDRLEVLGYLNSTFAAELLKLLNPTLHFQAGNIASLPYLPADERSNLKNIVKELLDLAKFDWDEFEVSWDFKRNPLVNFLDKVLFKSFECLIDKYSEASKNVAKLELEVDCIISRLFNFKNTSDSTINLENITLKINPFHRFKNSFIQAQQYSLISDLLSFSIGCMMGRYSLDRDGLVYAHSGNVGFKELIAEGGNQTFPADNDGIIPLASEDWFFDDDATTRFREFVTTVWGKEHLSENLAFVAESLCLHTLKPKKGEGAMDTIRRYFSTQFFKDHCKTYKKRPIYWLFSSGKEKAFECLVYLHRYNEGTLSRMRTEYVTPLMGKYEHHHSSLEQEILEGSPEQKRNAEKALKDLEKKQAELRSFDEQLKHYAEMRISLDLDDGVKVNYGKFGNLLADVKDIHGVAVK